ncbi:MAG: hypothetical protein U5J83_10230 [Bryobacterales bacterium]|nr:hypothetical protein [Bryobacterales bacterium]
MKTEGHFLKDIFECSCDGISVGIQKYFDGPLFNPVILARIITKESTLLFSERVAAKHWRETRLEFKVERFDASLDDLCKDVADYYSIPVKRVSNLIRPGDNFLYFLFVDKFGRLISLYRPMSGPLGDPEYPPFSLTHIDRDS